VKAVAEVAAGSSTRARSSTNADYFSLMDKVLLTPPGNDNDDDDDDDDD